MTRRNSVPPKYHSTPLPHQRYIPGHTPRPSSGLDSRTVAEPFSLAHSKYLYGIDLFNHGFWWEAHEAWEPLWKACERGSGERLFLQGLIQYAAFLLKWDQRNKRSAVRLAKAAGEKLVLSQAAFKPQSSTDVVGFDLSRWGEKAMTLAAAYDIQEDMALQDPLDQPEFPWIVLAKPSAIDKG